MRDFFLEIVIVRALFICIVLDMGGGMTMETDMDLDPGL